jgi:hypothetical protein
MKRYGGFLTGALLATLVAVPAYAQQPGTANDPHHPAASASAPAAPEVPPAPDSKGSGMPMMDMCRQMMGDAVGMPMASTGAAADPKEKADMLQMRGEMMKAMGDIMMKHARRMQGATAK